MKSVQYAFIILVVFLGTVARADMCESRGPSIECMDSVLSSVGYDRAKAAQACAGDVSVKCIDYVLSSVGYDRAKSAAVCKGGVSVECMEYVLSSVGYDKAKAALACGRN